MPEGAAAPADPHCPAPLHCPPLALAAAADLAAAVLNPSMDSWDQAPAASALEARTARELAALVYPYGAPSCTYDSDVSPNGPARSPRTDTPTGPARPLETAPPEAPARPQGNDRPDALVTTGGTESNQLGLLLAREHAHT
ncbi:amino acid decarboxylase, partial [Streptomyces rimosus subsp. rimosus]